MKRIILVSTTAFVAATAVYNNVAIAQFLQPKDNGIYSSYSKWNESNRDYLHNYFNPIEDREFLQDYQARTGSNAWFMNALDRGRNLHQEGELDFRSQAGNQRNERNRRERERRQRQQRRANYARAQETSSINLDAQDLRQPHYLTVTAEKDTQITGQITLNGRAIQTIRGNRTTINLSSFLSRGRHLIEVFGNYKPASSSVQVEFSAPGTKVSQATGGNGAVRQTLILDVR